MGRFCSAIGFANTKETTTYGYTGCALSFSGVSATDARRRCRNSAFLSQVRKTSGLQDRWNKRGILLSHIGVVAPVVDAKLWTLSGASAGTNKSGCPPALAAARAHAARYRSAIGIQEPPAQTRASRQSTDWAPATASVFALRRSPHARGGVDLLAPVDAPHPWSCTRESENTRSLRSSGSREASWD